MTDFVAKYFEEKKIEYFAVTAYAHQREINPGIIKRENFTPKSVIIYLLPYYSGETVNISRYASSLDYHLIISEINKGLCETLHSQFPNARMRGYGDHSPIDERYAALIGGLGILGDNGLLINEKYGSYVFIGDMLTDIEPELLLAREPGKIETCHSCGACKRACPTGILSGASSECLSSITQKKGELCDLEISLMRSYNTAWGCDECQKSCPYNKDPRMTPIDFFGKDRIPHLTEEILDNMTGDEFERRAFAWRGRKTVERNLKLLKNG